MLFVSIEQNSNLTVASLRHLNVLHKLHPTIRFEYTNHLLTNLRFNSYADNFFDDFLLTLHACLDSVFHGSRQEALNFFDYWTTNVETAVEVFHRIATTWPWTNRNKYYFLSTLFNRHNFYRLLHQSIPNTEPLYFLNGAALSLQYRNLTAPGQHLVTTLDKYDVHEIYTVAAKILRNGTNYELQNCINYWVRSFSNAEIVFNLLSLDADDILTAEQFSYLRDDNYMRLVLFRNCFKQYFEKTTRENYIEIDRLIKTSDKEFELVHKIPIFDIIITNTIGCPAELSQNLEYLEVFLKENMSLECSTLRHDIFKMIPNLLYLFASLIKDGHQTKRIGEFFTFLKCNIFESGVEENTYQAVIFSLRLYECVIKLLYGSREDRLIKEFNSDKNRRLRTFLISTEPIWDVCSPENYERLVRLLQSDYDDVRDIACELITRFFEPGNVVDLCKQAVNCSAIRRCGNAHYLSRVCVSGPSVEAIPLYEWLKHRIINDIKNFVDPLSMAMSGNHFFGALNCLSEYYNASSTKQSLDVNEDIRLIEGVVDVLLDIFRSSGVDNADGCSASFEKIDECFAQCIQNSKYISATNNYEEDKQFLQYSVWMSLKVNCLKLHKNSDY